MSLLRPALTYFAGIFALGFVLGTGRVLWLVPRLGETGAVLIELPIMLLASWLWARRVLRRYLLAARIEALAVGLTAFALLLLAERLLGLVAFGQDTREWLAGLATTPGLLGLAGQVLFALLPALVWKR